MRRGSTSVVIGCCPPHSSLNVPPRIAEPQGGTVHRMRVQAVTHMRADLPDPTRLSRATPADVPKMSQARRGFGSQQARRGHPPGRSLPEQPWQAGGITLSRRRACLWSRGRAGARHRFPGEGGDPRSEFARTRASKPRIAGSRECQGQGVCGPPTPCAALATGT